MRRCPGRFDSGKARGFHPWYNGAQSEWPKTASRNLRVMVFAGRQEQGFGQLLGQGAGSLGKTSLADILRHGPQDALYRQAAVLIKMPILYGQQGGF